MPTFKVDVSGLKTADRGLKRLFASVSDLRPFWRELGQTLADEAQRRWPLKRRSGALRESFDLGRQGVRPGRCLCDRQGSSAVCDADPLTGPMTKTVRLRSIQLVGKRTVAGVSVLAHVPRSGLGVAVGRVVVAAR